MRYFFAISLFLFISSNASAFFQDDLEELIAKESNMQNVLVKFINGKGIAHYNNIKITEHNINNGLFEVKVEDQYGRAMKIKGKYYEATNIPAFVDNMRADQAITESDIKTIKHPSDMIDGYVLDTSDIIGKSVRINTAKNKPIKYKYIRGKISIEKGQDVKVTFNKNGLHIESAAKALESGSIGDVIRLKNLESGKILSGKVANDETVIIGN